MCRTRPLSLTQNILEFRPFFRPFHFIICIAHGNINLKYSRAIIINKICSMYAIIKCIPMIGSRWIYCFCAVLFRCSLKANWIILHRSQSYYLCDVLISFHSDIFTGYDDNRILTRATTTSKNPVNCRNFLCVCALFLFTAIALLCTLHSHNLANHKSQNRSLVNCCPVFRAHTKKWYRRRDVKRPQKNNYQPQ